MNFRELLEQTNEAKKLIGSHESRADYHHTQFKRTPVLFASGVTAKTSENLKNKKTYHENAVKQHLEAIEALKSNDRDADKKSARAFEHDKMEPRI